VIYGVVVATLGFGAALFAIVWTFAQRMARRARERADAVVAGEGLDSLGAWSVNLLGSNSLARAAIRGVGVLVLTPTTIEFRLGYGSTSITIPQAAIRDVGVGTTFRIKGKVRRYRKPVVLTIRWVDDDSDRVAGFASHQAHSIAELLKPAP
jgi:hypothetical protein